MLCTNLMSSTEESISELLKNDDGGPVCMVNLLKFKKKARYEDGRETSLTGPEAYQIYGEGVAKMVNTIGGSIVFSAVVNGLVVGEVEEGRESLGPEPQRADAEPRGGGRRERWPPGRTREGEAEAPADEAEHR